MLTHSKIKGHFLQSEQKLNLYYSSCLPENKLMTRQPKQNRPFGFVDLFAVCQIMAVACSGSVLYCLCIHVSSRAHFLLIAQSQKKLMASDKGCFIKAANGTDGPPLLQLYNQAWLRPHTLSELFHFHNGYAVPSFPHCPYHPLKLSVERNHINHRLSLQNNNLCISAGVNLTQVPLAVFNFASQHPSGVFNAAVCFSINSSGVFYFGLIRTYQLISISLTGQFHLGVWLFFFFLRLRLFSTSSIDTHTHTHTDTNCGTSKSKTPVFFTRRIIKCIIKCTAWLLSA